MTNITETENKNGIFGPIYDQFCGQPKLAIKHLLKMQNGERPKALHRIFVIEITYVIFKNYRISNNSSSIILHFLYICCSPKQGEFFILRY